MPIPPSPPIAPLAILLVIIVTPLTPVLAVILIIIMPRTIPHIRVQDFPPIVPPVIAKMTGLQPLSTMTINSSQSIVVNIRVSGANVPNVTRMQGTTLYLVVPIAMNTVTKAKWIMTIAK